MKLRVLLYSILVLFLVLSTSGCVPQVCCISETKTVAIYEDHTIPANMGISRDYINVDGYRYVNVVVEFEQNAHDEEPVSMSVMFAHDDLGKLGSGRYFTYEENYEDTAQSQRFSLSGRGSWHGHPHNISRYTARIPIMGPYMKVFPFNHHHQPRKISITLYLTR